jgi:hypothetical protein
MKSTRRKFKALLTKHCAGMRIITGMRAAIDEKSVEVSIDAKGTRKSRRIAKLARRTRRLEKELGKAFPHRKVNVQIWVTDKKSTAQKVSKPFRGRNIVLIIAPARPIKLKS